MGDKTIIGLTGPFGSGCTYISRTFLETSGYRYLSLSEILRNEVGDDGTLSRTALQDRGNQLRKQEGADVLAKKACEIIEREKDEKWVY